MAHDVTKAISSLTERVVAFRAVYIVNRGIRMPSLIEIKGLATSVAAAKQGIADMRAASTELQTESSALVAELKDVTAQVKAARADLKFEAATLGNSAPTPLPQVVLSSQSGGSVASAEPAS